MYVSRYGFKPVCQRLRSTGIVMEGGLGLTGTFSTEILIIINEVVA